MKLVPYLPSMADQTRVFLYAFGFGFALGILYDLFRVVRLLLARGRWYLLAQDIFYFLCCTVLSFFFFLAVSDGGWRSYGVGGEILGWLVYYFSLGTVALRASEWTVRAVRRAVLAVVWVISLPFRWAAKLFRRFYGGCRKFFKKICFSP
ncbi:MAG: spore cortex biosynthesis protein YabQ [Oscillospiraceae bacterium]|jgi:hypothetical protein|nr:spore cortex biosynthesis protein YabQ [Oscillospiraceae bacterium]